jgi:tRNA(fMet)-specific endonuclease VapC
MILLDTDHLSILTESRQSLRHKLWERLDGSGENLGLPVVSVEEQLRSWLAQIRRAKNAHQQIVPYARLAKLIDFVRDWTVVDWNEPAADVFVTLRRQRIRVGTQDLKIAAITLANDALLLSANRRDFEEVPGLRVEDWLHD